MTTETTTTRNAQTEDFDGACEAAVEALRAAAALCRGGIESTSIEESIARVEYLIGRREATR
jgi:3-hydroxy-3-methylglutaryl CoA synthase